MFLVACASRVDAYACPGRVGGHDELRRAASGCACTCSGYDLYVAAACEPLIFMPMETRARSAVWRLTRGHDPVGPGTQRLEIKEILIASKIRNSSFGCCRGRLLNFGIK